MSKEYLGSKQSLKEEVREREEVEFYKVMTVLILVWKLNFG
jgi:hypothetical protein